MLAETLLSAKNRPKKRTPRKSENSRPKTPTPAVIYTQPLPFNRDRLIVQLITVTAVVLAIVMGLSVFFKVKTVTVTGADTYSAWAVREASGISEGDKLLTFSKIRAASQIMANLPYVKGVRIGIKLPDTVNIMIEEESVVYAIKSSDGQWWMMDSDGRVVEQANNAKAATATQVLGVTLEAPTVNEKGVATEMTPSETNELGELIPVTTTGAQRLTAALQILKALENNDIVGEAASVDVTSTEDIILWYGTRYQVNLGDTSRLDYKVDCMNDAILQMTAKILAPIIILLGIYVVLNGHLSPGGGFSGGAIMGAGLMIYVTAFGFKDIRRFFTYKTYQRVVLCSLLTYAASKCYSFYTGANDIHSIIPLGTPGAILSSGLILVLNICVGFIVTCTMYAFYAVFRKGEV